MRVERSVVVTCSGCGIGYELAVRNVRVHRRLGTPHVCASCRRRPKQLDAKRHASMRGWWLDRYTLEQLRSWPPFSD